ncbi:hypothetical protein EON80_08175, partial [bacterium]
MLALLRPLGLRGLLLSCFLLFLSFFQPVEAQTDNVVTQPTVAATAKPSGTEAAALAAATSVAAPVMPRPDATLGQRAQSLFGLLVLTGICFIVGRIRHPKMKPMMRTVLWGLALQFIFAIVVFYTPGFFKAVNGAMDGLLGFSEQGARFLFGNLVKNNVPVGTPLTPNTSMGPLSTTTSYAGVGAFFAFSVLPTIIFFSALSTMMYYLGILQPIVRGLSWIMQRTMGTSGSETLSGVANIFLGQTEAPLFVRPFIATCTKSELMAIMVGGFSNIASGVLGAYVGMLVGFEPD